MIAASAILVMGCGAEEAGESAADAADAGVPIGRGIITIDAIAELVEEPDAAEMPEVTADAGGDADPISDGVPVAEVEPTVDVAPEVVNPPECTFDPDTGGPVCSEDDLSELYTKYVEPFVSGAVTQSCSQCHMTGIDISMYGQDTPCDTMACMVNLGAVDLDDPSASQLLEGILMGSPNSSVFDVEAEYAAMLEWIEWSAMCHGTVCGEISDACNAGTGAESTGMTPLGDCSEDDMLAVFWDAVIIDRGRCVTCHSDYAAEIGKFGPCATVEDCSGPQLCTDGICHSPYPLSAPHFFEGSCTGSGNQKDCKLKWNNPEHKQIGLNTMYNIVALGLMDTDVPVNSLLMIKPLLEDFHPTAIYGDNVSLENIPAGVGTGVEHGGTSKINFGCHEEPCPKEGIVDCRTHNPCNHDSDCPDAMNCLGEPGQKYCRIHNSLCDTMYVHMVGFAEYYATCNAAP